MSQFIQSFTRERLSLYEKFQLSKYGNILHTEDFPDENIENTEVSEWMERQAEIIEQKETEG